jgi:hypothetical protein
MFRAVRFEIHEYIKSISNKKGDTKNCSNYRDISHLPTIYKMLSNILQSRLPPYAEELVGDHQCGF